MVGPACLPDTRMRFSVPSRFCAWTTILATLAGAVLLSHKSASPADKGLLFTKIGTQTAMWKDTFSSVNLRAMLMSSGFSALATRSAAPDACAAAPRPP